MGLGGGEAEPAASLPKRRGPSHALPPCLPIERLPTAPSARPFDAMCRPTAGFYWNSQKIHILNHNLMN